eukprot:2012173-Amphidinium_carterae.1
MNSLQNGFSSFPGTSTDAGENETEDTGFNETSDMEADSGLISVSLTLEGDGWQNLTASFDSELYGTADSKADSAEVTDSQAGELDSTISSGAPSSPLEDAAFLSAHSSETLALMEDESSVADSDAPGVVDNSDS